MERSQEPPAPGRGFEEEPLTRSEYITALVHLYRGEMNRANTWRNRLDATTNWAVVTTAAMLSFAFNQPAHSHVTLLLANLMILLFLGFEARRFRYFDVWRARIRMMEENFFLPIIRRNLVSPRAGWRDFVSEDLDHPTFKVTLLQAIGMRLRRNYIGLFAVLLVAWLAKLTLHPDGATASGQVLERMAIGPLPGWSVLVLTLLFYAALLWIAMWRGGRSSSDEVIGVEKEIDHWKI
jgi:uncharacterized membrane protein